MFIACLSVSYIMQPICTHKISVQSSKPSHAYPIIRLPREFRELAGATATIYQTVHDGALAFLVVVNSQQDHKLKMGSESKKRLYYGNGRTSWYHALTKSTKPFCFAISTAIMWLHFMIFREGLNRKSLQVHAASSTMYSSASPTTT